MHVARHLNQAPPGSLLPESLREGRLDTFEIASGDWRSGCAVRDLELPPGVLLVVIRREAGTLVPEGDKLLQDGDRVTAFVDDEVWQAFQAWRG